LTTCITSLISVYISTLLQGLESISTRWTWDNDRSHGSNGQHV